MIRLTADFWVGAYLARLRGMAIPAYVVARGDATAGSVLVKQSPLDGQATLWERFSGHADGERHWVQVAAAAEPAIDAQIARARARDPDLWVIEVEDRDGRHLLNQQGLD